MNTKEVGVRLICGLAKSVHLVLGFVSIETFSMCLVCSPILGLALWLVIGEAYLFWVGMTLFAICGAAIVSAPMLNPLRRFNMEAYSADQIDFEGLGSFPSFPPLLQDNEVR
jgi:uncharacterized ion transporter superfamily protein YfcC